MSETLSPNAQVVSIPFDMQPASARIMSFNLTLVSGVTQNLDLRPIVNNKQLNSVQGIFIDNSQSSNAVTVSSGQQNIIVPPNAQGMAPLFVTTTMVLNFSGNGDTNITLTNFPLPASVWSAQAAGLPVTGGKVQVQDVALENLIAYGGLQNVPLLLSSGDAAIHKRVGNAYSGEITAEGTTTVISGSPNCFVTGISIQADPALKLSVAGAIKVVTQFVNGGVICTDIVQVGTANVGNLYPLTELTDLDLLGTDTGDDVEIIVSAIDGGGTIATGGILYTIFGGTTGVA